MGRKRVSMENERINRLISVLVRLLAARPHPDPAGQRLYARITAEGYALDEIQEAVSLLSRAAENLSAAEPLPEPPAAAADRALAPFERLRLSDSALDLFQHWQAMRLMTPRESEALLHHVVTSGAGLIETDDLIGLAREISESGSTFHLFLDATDTAH